MKGKRLMFFATEDWFVRSHFLPLLRRAVDDGFDVSVAARSSGALAGVSGVRIIDTQFDRRSLLPWSVWKQVARLEALIENEQPDIIHAIASKPIALLLMARNVSQIGRAFALTGRGYLAASRSPIAALAAERFRAMLRRGLDRGDVILLVENASDRRWVEGSRPLADARVVMMPGAGVDRARFQPAPEPPGRIVVGVAARLVRSKGIDLLVDAVRQLRAARSDVELRIAGSADADNPEHVSAAELEIWRATDGVTLLGRVSDTSRFWPGMHIACLPSRGGEGLPRVLLEAASCGRPIVTTDVPGCADFVLNNETGLVVQPGDSSALAAALAKLANDAALRRRLGERARARVVTGYTEEHAAAAASGAWRALLK